MDWMLLSGWHFTATVSNGKDEYPIFGHIWTADTEEKIRLRDLHRIRPG